MRPREAMTERISKNPYPFFSIDDGKLCFPSRNFETQKINKRKRKARLGDYSRNRKILGVVGEAAVVVLDPL